MQLKTFSARSSAQVLAQIKEELGPDAIIIETREEDGMVFMTAALERDSMPPVTAPARPPAPARASAAAESSAFAPIDGRAPGASRAAPYYAPGAFAPGGAGPSWQQWQDEWNSIKGHLLALLKPALKLDQLPPRQRLAVEFLQKEGLDDEAVLELYQMLQKDASSSILGPLGRMTPVRTWDARLWPQRIQFIAGPFGAGKTSVAMRMALYLRKTAPDMRICLVNADATRGNGRLLLRHYSELSDMAYKEAATTLELVSALHQAAKEGFDRVMVDLPGLARGGYLSTLLADAGFAPGADGPAVHLALPPHYGGLQLKAILSRYRTPHAGSIVWTKLDEAEHYGQIVNVGLATGLPVSALSYGPGLGNSLVPAQSAMLWRLLFKRELPA